MPAPTFVASYSSAYNTTTATKNLSITTQAGDLLVVYGGGENHNALIDTAPNGNGVSFTLQQSIIVTNFASAYLWTGTDAAGGNNWTLQAGLSAGYNWGFSCLVFRSHGGLGNTNKTNSTGLPSVNLTTSAHSAIVAFNGDWNAGDGGTRTWRTIDGITPTAGNTLERDYTFVNGAYTIYGAYYNDVATAGTYAAGLTLPIDQEYSIVVVEVLGATAVGIPIAWLTT